MRSLAALVFIGLVGTMAVYFAQRPTVARGDALAAILIESSHNPLLKALDCDREVPFGVKGATFECDVEFKNGDRVHAAFTYDRDGRILQTDRSAAQRAPQIKKTSDPWGD